MLLKANGADVGLLMLLLAARLKQEAETAGTSMNRTVKRLLEQAVGWAADGSPLILGAIPTVSTYGMLIFSMLISVTLR